MFGWWPLYTAAQAARDHQKVMAAITDLAAKIERSKTDQDLLDQAAEILSGTDAQIDAETRRK